MPPELTALLALVGFAVFAVLVARVCDWAAPHIDRWIHSGRED